MTWAGLYIRLVRDPRHEMAILAKKRVAQTEDAIAWKDKVASLEHLLSVGNNDWNDICEVLCESRAEFVRVVVFDCVLSVGDVVDLDGVIVKSPSSDR